MDDAALTDELAKLGQPADDAPATDEQPAKRTGRRRSSGTSGAERARRAKAAGDKPAPTAPKRTSSRTQRKPAIGAGMANLYTMAGGLIATAPFGPPAVAGPHAGSPILRPIGAEIINQADSIGSAWEQAAKDDARIREALEKLLTVSTVGQLVAAHVPILLAAGIASGHIPQEVVMALVAAQQAGAAADGQNTGGRP